MNLRTAVVKASMARAGGGVVGGFAREEGLHVGFAVGEGEEAALMVEELFERVSGQVFVAEEVDEDAGVEVAAAGAHGDAAGGREAHGGVDGFAVEDGGDAGAVAEVRDDEALRDGREARDDGLAGEAVEAVADDAGVVKARGDGEV